MFIRLFMVVLSCVVCQGAFATDDSAAQLYQEWQHSPLFSHQNINKNDLQQLVRRADLLLKNSPDDPQALAISGMLKGFYAGQVSNLEGLKTAKQARDELQRALTLDPHVFNGDAYAELGSLYHRTPGWPFSFGSQVMAEKLLNKALEIDPHSALVNLRFGEYCYDQKDYSLARQYLQLAIDAIPSTADTTWLDFQMVHARQMLAKLQ